MEFRTIIQGIASCAVMAYPLDPVHLPDRDVQSNIHVCRLTKITCMKKGQIIFILAILSIITCIVLPVMAANETPQDEATVFYNRGVQLLAANDYERAISSFDQALASNITLIKMSDGLLYTYQGKGHALIQLGRYDDAIRTLDLALGLFPNDTILWNNKGYALFKLQRYDQAVAAYDRALALDNTFTNSFINKGDALYQMGKYSEAIAAYNKALETDPGNSVATNGLELAQKAAATSSADATKTTLIILVIIIIVAAGGVIWYIKFRKPAEVEKPENLKKKK